ncbi:hypothetical protein PAXRUDRAFT_597534 [Paxillus rubicundulus Ve08.2h10]|uniref:Unplaced genomic scaffold scaffold_4982, whole genome shotgun sequence n=1 Tax=Paxillus rubicundulus Ve08.2h10 TaxID=930991 RepID=A0A0D0D8I7_9AGAM|nr:hypothetical protein PAXRUDRAFT_597534 [Paxillus rubicundulus Ve08.2h10]
MPALQARKFLKELHRRQRHFTLTLDDSFAVQCRVVIGRHTYEKGSSLSYTKIKPGNRVSTRLLHTVAVRVRGDLLGSVDLAELK